MPSTVTQDGPHRSRDLIPTDQQGLEDLWGVYGADYDEIMQEAEHALSDDLEVAPLQSMLEERRLNSKDVLCGFVEDDLPFFDDVGLAVIWSKTTVALTNQGRAALDAYTASQRDLLAGL